MADPIEVERGGRVKDIRLERGEEQGEFAGHLNAAAEALGLSVRYLSGDVSRRETGRKALDVDDFATVAMLDPQKRGWMWVAFGKAITVGRDAWELLAGQQPKKKSG